MACSTPGSPDLHYLPEFDQINVHCISNAIQQSYPLSSSFLQSFPASRSFLMTQLFPSDSQSIGVLEFQLQHQSLQLIFRVDFFRTDWLDLLAGWGTLNSLLQHHTLKASILQLSAFFMVQFSYPYMTTGKTIKVMSLLSNTLSGFVIAFLSRSKHLLISWLKSSSVVILEPKKIKSVPVSIVSPSICHEVMELNSMIFVFWSLHTTSRRSPRKRNAKGKMVVWGGLTNNLEKKRSKKQRRKERHTHLNAEFQRIARIH